MSLKTHFHMKGFARGLGLKQRQKVTWRFTADHLFAAANLVLLCCLFCYAARIGPKTPHEYIRVIYEYIRVTYE